MAPKTFSTLTKTATNFYYPKSTLVSPKTAQLYLMHGLNKYVYLTLITF